MHDERRRAGGDGGGRERQRKAAAPQIGPEPEAHQQRTLDPPGGQRDEDRGEQRVLEGRGGLDERMVEIDERGHPRNATEASKVGALLVAVNRNASGLEDPEKTARELVAVLEELGERAAAVVTDSERELWDVLRSAEKLGPARRAGGRRRHRPRRRQRAAAAAARAGPGADRPREQRGARARHPDEPRRARWQWPPGAPAQPIDALRVATPDRFVYAVEAVSAGFQAEARAGYEAENSADLIQGLRALARAVRRYRAVRRERGRPRAPAALRSPRRGSALPLEPSLLRLRLRGRPGRRSVGWPPRGDPDRGARPRPRCCGCSPPPGAAGTSAGAACRACPRPAPA